nr:uncharacterized protein LOC129282616 [Lytechinus pictus]
MDSTTHQFLVPHLDQQTPRSSSDPGPLNKIGEPETQSRSRSREESVSEFDNDGTSSNCNDKTESDLDGELDELTIRIDPPDLLPGQRSRLDSLVSKNCSVAEAQAQAFLKLQEELMKAKETLQLKDEEVEQLSRVREEVDREITELTASLFEEANAMVQEANIKRAAAERRLKEANGKVNIGFPCNND